MDLAVAIFLTLLIVGALFGGKSFGGTLRRGCLVVLILGAILMWILVFTGVAVFAAVG